MHLVSQSDIDFDGVDLRAVRRRFLTINHDRLKRVHASLRDSQKSFLDLLPLLFHINHPMLPGYLSAKTPAGISDYSPTRRSVAAGKDLSQSFIYRRRAKRNFDIHAIFIMGSSGTIAYSATSDFDIWLCVRPDLSPAQQAALRRKAQGIESWAASLNLEVHFFLMNDEAFRSGKLDHISEEGSGTAQHHLLLDEFYRTGLLVAGRYPIWWLVPPHYESDYDYYVSELKRKRFVAPHETVDFGGVAHIPPGEFFGATLWQLYKGVSSPYKSVLKLMLMEAYAAEYPDTNMLSLHYKQAVHGGETRLDELDPYVSMCNRVEAYLTARGETERLDLARRCFYFKVRERMSRPDRRGNITWRRELMRELVNTWNWSQSRLLTLDSRPSWKILRVLEERKTLVQALSDSYRMLSDFAREYADSQTIDPRELNLLGRRLYTAFERKAGKVDIINPGISGNLIENRLSLHQLGTRQGGWVLYRGDVRPEDAEKHTPLKRGHSLIEIIAWCHFNGLLHPVATMVSLHPDDCGVSVWELRSIMDCLQDLFSDLGVHETALEDLARSARLQKAVVFINIGTDPLSSINREGLLRVSNRTDALSYGGCRENLALTFDQILVNSWQEVLTFRYRSEHALMEWLCDYLAWYPQSAGEAPPSPAVFSFSSTRGAPIAHRIEDLATQVIQCFYHNEWRERARYVVQVGHSYYVLQPENDVPRYTYIASSSALLKHLSLPQSTFSPIILDQHALAETRIPLLLAANQAGKIQLFYEVCGDKAEVFVLDELGSLFQQQVAFHDHYALLAQYQQFLESVQRRRDLLLQEDGTTACTDAVHYYQIISNRAGQVQIKDEQINPFQHPEHYLGVQVIGEIVDTDQVVFNVYCNDEEFSTLEYGEQLFTEVARHILRQRPSGQPYPIYITDIDLPRGLLDGGNPDQLQTVHFLKHKKRIEQHLNDALAGLEEASEEHVL
jgi:adenylate cyclase class 1